MHYVNIRARWYLWRLFLPENLLDGRGHALNVAVIGLGQVQDIVKDGQNAANVLSVC